MRRNNLPEELGNFMELCMMMMGVRSALSAALRGQQERDATVFPAKIARTGRAGEQKGENTNKTNTKM